MNLPRVEWCQNVVTLTGGERGWAQRPQHRRREERGRGQRTSSLNLYRRNWRQHVKLRAPGQIVRRTWKVLNSEEIQQKCKSDVSTTSLFRTRSFDVTSCRTCRTSPIFHRGAEERVVPAKKTIQPSQANLKSNSKCKAVQEPHGAAELLKE